GYSPAAPALPTKTYASKTVHVSGHSKFVPDRHPHKRTSPRSGRQQRSSPHIVPLSSQRVARQSHLQPECVPGPHSSQSRAASQAQHHSIRSRRRAEPSTETAHSPESALAPDNDRSARSAK